MPDRVLIIDSILLQLCTYFTDPEVCIGPVATHQVKRVMEHTGGEKRQSSHPEHGYMRYR